MKNVTHPIYQFENFTQNHAVIFGFDDSENTYKSLFFVFSVGCAYLDIPHDLLEYDIHHPMMSVASLAGYKKLSKALPQRIVEEDVPEKCLQHECFSGNGVLNHINPITDGVWTELTGVTPKDIQDAFDQAFCERSPTNLSA